MQVKVKKVRAVELHLTEHEARALSTILDFSQRLKKEIGERGVDADAVEDVSEDLFHALAASDIEPYGE